MMRARTLLPLPLLLISCGAPEVAAPDETNGDGDPAASASPLEAAADASLRLSASALFFGDHCSGEQTALSLTVTNDGEDPVRVSGLAVSGQGFALLNRPTLPLTLSPGQGRTLRLRFTPPKSRTAPYQGNLRITSNDPGGRNRDVPLSGLSLPPLLSVEPRQHDFGTLDDGESRSTNLTLRTSGSCPVSLGSTRLTGNLATTLRVGSLPQRVDPGEVETISVRLRCSGQDDLVQATLRILDDDGNAAGSSQLRGYCSR